MWHRLKHNVSGEVRYAADLAGEDLQTWTATPLAEDRCPLEHEVTNDAGVISVDAALQTALTEENQLNKMTDRQRFRMAVRLAKAELIDDLQAENIITANQATRLRNRLGVA